MDLKSLQRHWDELGRSDPLWAVLTREDARGNRWDTDEFFAHGRREIDALMADLERLRRPRERLRALDFGCGAGRLSQALAGHFAQVDGVDIAPAMIEAASRYNRQGDRCRFHANGRPDLALFPDRTFDLVYSGLTLQHMEPEYARGYVTEFMRVLKPDGLAVFQVPSERRLDPAAATRGDRLKAWIDRTVPELALTRLRRLRARWRTGGEPVMEMYGIPQDKMLRFLERLPATVAEVREDPSVDARWRSFRYCVAPSPDPVAR
jgi:SAM-dependent methyltransferase